MIHIDGAVVVEGKYDKIKLSRIVDCPIIATDGFGIFKDREKAALIRHFARNGGIVILTDSDAAGFKIRGYIRSIVSEGSVKNVYIPDIFGKERRKSRPSVEGKLGVEGMPESVIESAFQKAGILSEPLESAPEKITRADLYADGLYGGENSSARRSELLKKLKLPQHLSVSGLLDVLNASVGKKKYHELIKVPPCD